MPKQVLTRRRSWTARIAVLAVVLSIFAVALPASAHSVAIDTSVSCPPTTPNAGFTDIGAFGADVQLAINCLAMFGITTGTTATTYSPNGTVLRWQMALFLVRQAADHGLTIPAATSQGYTDIAGLPQATIDAINQVTQLGISKGTSSTTFSPNDVVTRWQMALFLRRLAVAAGVSVTDDPAHNQFTDIGAYTAEIQAAINYLADAHIALGVGGSLYDGNSAVARWQMALFLTRVLAADGVTPPAGFRVTVTPTDAVSLGAGTARAYTATFRNANGTVYTGAVGITLRSVVSGVVQYDNDPVPNGVIESTSDTPTLTGVGTATVTGFPGADGIISFTVRHVGAGQAIVPIAWEDLDGDLSPEITGNTAPTEPHGLGGVATFATAALAECTDVTGDGAFAVTLVDKAGDRYEANGCSLFYDSGDLFLIGGAPTDLAGFEAALNTTDVVTSAYDPDAADQSTFNITTNNDPAVTVTDPTAAGATTSAATYTVVGTASGGFTVRIYKDLDNDGALDAGEPLVASGTAAADGAWSLPVPLTSGVANDFIVTQRSTPAGTDGPYTNVPTITQTSGAGVTFTSTDLTTSAGAAAFLDPGDVITIVFSGDVTGVGSGDTFTVVDPDGSSATITCGAAGNADCAEPAAGTVTVTITNVLVTAGGTAGIAGSGTITAVTGFTGTNGVAPQMVGDRTFAIA